jgi:hypothetical protein
MLHIFSLAPPPTYAATTEIILEPCALNAEFQPFIPRFNKISLLCGPPLKEGFEDLKLFSNLVH